MAVSVESTVRYDELTADLKQMLEALMMFYVQVSYKILFKINILIPCNNSVLKMTQNAINNLNANKVEVMSEM